MAAEVKLKTIGEREFDREGSVWPCVWLAVLVCIIGWLLLHWHLGAAVSVRWLLTRSRTSKFQCRLPQEVLSTIGRTKARTRN